MLNLTAFTAKLASFVGKGIHSLQLLYSSSRRRSHAPLHYTPTLLGTLLLSMFVLANVAYADNFQHLDEAIPGSFVADLAPVFDFDSDACLPSAGISRTGKQNGGLKNSGKITGGCRPNNFLDLSNTYHRYTCATQDGHTYCGHIYTLYFEKDQVVAGVDPFGHKHDWEYAAIWTTDGAITHGSVSTHHTAETKALADLPMENGHLKVVYHKDGGSTHDMRFAKTNEQAKNPYGYFVTPTLVSWYTMTGDGIDNATMRNDLDTFNYGKAVVPMKDDNFLSKINGIKPSGYPTFTDGGSELFAQPLFMSIKQHELWSQIVLSIANLLKAN